MKGGVFTSTSELYHHGIKGMKWGIRRYQNEDGSLTEAGKKRYGPGISERDSKKTQKYIEKEQAKLQRQAQRIHNYMVNQAARNKLTESGRQVMEAVIASKYDEWKKSRKNGRS